MTRRHRHGAFCDICGCWCGPDKITDHHIKKRAVFGPNDYKLKPLCRACHDLVETEVSKRENELLIENQKYLYFDSYYSVRRGVWNESKRNSRKHGKDDRTDGPEHRKNPRSN